MNRIEKYLIDLRSMTIVSTIGGLIFWYGYGWMKGMLFAAALMIIMHLPLVLRLLISRWQNKIFKP